MIVITINFIDVGSHLEVNRKVDDTGNRGRVRLPDRAHLASFYTHSMWHYNNVYLSIHIQQALM